MNVCPRLRPQWLPTLLLVGFFALMSVGCTGDQRMERLAGNWKLNLKSSDAIVDQLLDGQLPEDANMMQKLAHGATKQMIKSKVNEAMEASDASSSFSMVLNFRADGTWSSETDFPMAQGKKSGLWKVVSEEGDNLTINCRWTEEKSRKTESVRTTIHFDQPDRIRLVPPNMSATELELTFDRDPAK